MAISRPVMNSSKRSVMPRLVSRRARERRHFDRVVDDEGRLPQLRFGRLLEQRQLQRADARVQERGCWFDAELLQLGAQERGIAQLRVGVLRRVLADRLDDRQPMRTACARSSSRPW